MGSATDRWAAWVPWLTLACLTALCATYGALAVSNATHPPDVDSLRDLGFIQADLDGNWFGDPTYAGEARWYPPLIHAIGAGLVWLTGAPPPALWVQAGPWLNLLIPITFFLLAARLFNPITAAISTAALVLFNGAFVLPYNQAGYTPWPLTPHLALPFFFAGAIVVHALGGSRRFRDAVLVGATIGVVSLVHTVPAILLATMSMVVAFGLNGLTRRTLIWLSLSGVVAFVVAFPFVGPLILRYGLVVKNAAPTLWTDLLFTPGHILELVALNLPGVAALGAIVIGRVPIGRATILTLQGWIVVCLIFLGRHELCLTVDLGMACRVFALPVHHYHFYLSAAWALLTGHALQYFATRWALLRSVALIAGTGLLVVAFPLRWVHEAANSDEYFDGEAYHWILAHTEPTALFITSDEASMFTLMAAARRLVAAPMLHSNPFVPWPPLNGARENYLASGCGNNHDDLYFMLPIGNARDPGGMTAFSGPQHTIFRCAIAAR